MDDHTDDRDPGLPPVGTPEELEEALKWLEDLTARQGKPADLTNPVPAASLDSPFRGLIDSEDGDLPDWLREVPTSPGEAGFEDSEPESRLDWLAKMAQRESIEELPTLEWRRLSEPAQSAILGTQPIEIPAAEQDSDDETQPDAEPVSNIEIETEATEGEEGLIDFVEEVETEAQPVELDDLIDEPTPDQVIVTGSVDELAETELAGDEIVALQDEFEIRGQDETVESASQHKTSAGEYDQPLDDLDAAMAWLEELAASQDAPIEDVPSVADRALASKLMMEAGLSPTVSPLDELGSDSSLDNITPTHPFIDEEDFADTVVLVETLAADQGTSTIVPEEPEAAVVYPEAMPAALDEPDFTGEYGDIPDLVQSPEELSFDEAMAFLDEIAGSQTNDPAAEPEAEGIEEMMAAVDSVDEIEPELVPDLPDMPEAIDMENLPSDSLSAEEVPWLDSSPEALVIESIEEYMEQENVAQPMVEGLNGTGYNDWEATLQDLDALALPPGKTLDDISASLRTAQVSPWRDVGSALAWLEETLSREVTVAPIELDDAELVDLMPEDPDAVLAWLEQMAAEEETRLDSNPVLRDEPSGVITSPQQAEPKVEELVEADLLNMPEDPDEAMAWLEGLARGSQQQAEHPEPAIDAPSVAYPPDEYLTEFDAPGETIAEEIESADSEVEAAVALDFFPSVGSTTDWGESADEVSLPDLLPLASAEVDIERREDTVGFDGAPVDDIEAIFDEVIVELETTLIDEATPTEHADVALPAETSEETPEIEIIVIPSLDAEGESRPVEPILLVTTEEAGAEAEAGEPERHETSSDTETLATTRPARKRGRAKITVVEEEPQTVEPSAPAAPEAKPPVPSWIDLLKPLD
jgi:hypothetical protein